MPATQSKITVINNPDSGLPGENHRELLQHLGSPTWITVKGRDSTRRRAIVTLLHGNEPSGLIAVHRLLSGDLEPATDLGIMIAAVDAALSEPMLSHRYIPTEKDLNRCFSPPYSTSQEQLAGNIIDIISDYEPEALIDTHNTSAHSRPFCVAVREDSRTQAIAGLFSDTLVVIDQQMGTLLHHLPAGLPAATVEFGGFMDPNADLLATETLRRFISIDQLPDSPGTPIRTLRHPLRLETEHHLDVAYSSSIDESRDLTIINTIDQLNFHSVSAGTPLGWFTAHEHRNLVARNISGKDTYGEYFTHTDGLLQTRVPMTIFMATTDPVVANNDCLLYFTPH